MDKEDEMAVFRCQVVGPLLHMDDGRSLKNRIREQSDRIYTLPDGRLRQFSPGAVEEWLYAYRRGGLAALKNRPRSDKGGFRGIGTDASAFIDRHVKEHPRLNTRHLLGLLRKEGLVRDGHPSESTVYRYVRSIRPAKGAPTQERRAFEAPYSGNLWQTDFMYGPFLPRLDDRGRWSKKQAFLVVLLDDHSRLLCHGQFYFRQDVAAYMDCLKTALRKRGIPEKIYCDNGQVFLSSQVRRIMAELGSVIIHTGVRDCQAKGKVERFFLTVRTSFLNPLMEMEPPKSLDELNRKFWRWGEEEYNQKKHSATGMPPVERWMASAHRVRLLKAGCEDEAFLFETSRMVKKDGTFSLDGKTYETSWTLSGKKITVRHDPFRADRPRVRHEKNDYGAATLLDRNFNSRMPGRKKGKDTP
jgi:transposase InsO family protein